MKPRNLLMSVKSLSFSPPNAGGMTKNSVNRVIYWHVAGTILEVSAL